MLDIGPMRQAWQERCPNCFGRGSVPYPRRVADVPGAVAVAGADGGHTSVVAEFVSCVFCDGSGMIRVGRG